MPRALPAQLTSAMASGAGDVYLALGKRTYDAVPPTALTGHTTLITSIMYYKYDGLDLTVKWSSANLPELDGLTLGNKYYFERGVKIAGVAYTIRTASLRFDDYTISRQIVTAKFSLFSSLARPVAISGNDSYTNVLTALNPNDYELGTVIFRATAENLGHWDYKFFGVGDSVELRYYRQLLGMIRQKYLLQAVDASDDDNEDEIEFYHLGSPATGLKWMAVPVGSSADWRSVCWSPELTLFVAVSYTGTVMTSPDGITWTARTATSASQWASVCWSPELTLFVAVAVSGTHRVMTSPDGITWTARTPAEVNPWASVCWSPELTLFVAVATVTGTNLVMTSLDGITWTARAAAAVNYWISVIWSSELTLFVAVSYQGFGGAQRVMTSPDGETWFAQVAAEANNWYSVCWSPELTLFVAVAYTGTNRVMTSPDGITWTAHAAAEANLWFSVCWSLEFSLFVAVSTDGTHRAMTSPDGITWTVNELGFDVVPSFIVSSPACLLIAVNGATFVKTYADLVPDHVIEQGDVILKTDNRLQAFEWRDESAVVQTSGATGDVVHNLGYLETGDYPPVSYENSNRASVVVGINLAYRTGDIFTLRIGGTQEATYFGRVVEVLDPNAAIGWRCEIELIERFPDSQAAPIDGTQYVYKNGGWVAL